MSLGFTCGQSDFPSAIAGLFDGITVTNQYQFLAMVDSIPSHTPAENSVLKQASLLLVCLKHEDLNIMISYTRLTNDLLDLRNPEVKFCIYKESNNPLPELNQSKFPQCPLFI